MDRYFNDENDSARNLINKLQNLMEEYDISDVDHLLEIVSDPDYMGQLVNNNYLAPDRPLYKDVITPIADWLLPLWRMETEVWDGLREFLEEIAASVEKQDSEVVAADLHNYFLNLIVFFDHHAPQYVWRLWGALWITERLKLDQCADIAFVLLRQDYFFVDFYFGDVSCYAIQAFLYRFYQNQPAKLLDFLNEEHIVPESRVPVFCTLTMITYYNPGKRIEAVNCLIKYLGKVYEVSQQNGNMQNIETYVMALTDHQVRETLPMLKKIYDNSLFMRVLIADSKEVEEMMDEDDNIPNEEKNMDEVLEYDLCRYADNSDPYDFDDD